MKLTATTVKSIAPTERRQEIPDDLLPGLYLTIQPTGKKSWQVRYRAGGKHRRMTLGKYPALGLGDARTRARDVMREAQGGADPAADARKAKRESPSDTVGAVLDDYAKRKLSKLKSGANAAQFLDRFARKEWADRPLSDIARRDVQDLIDQIADSGRGTTANRVLAHVKTFMAWAVSRDLIDANPAANVKPPAKEVKRDRHLSDDEIRWFWQACEAEGYPWGVIGKLLLLTGQRLSEIAELVEGELNGESLRLPASRTKNGKPHDLPISITAFDILEAMPRVKNPKRYLFTTNARTPVQGYDKAKKRLTSRMAEIATKDRGEIVEIPHWTFHDLRRTCATGMAKDSPVVVVEKSLNHVSGALAGVAGIYNRHAYAREMRDAVDLWADRIDAILGNRIDPESGEILEK